MERRPVSSGLTPEQAVTALREGLETYLAAGGYPDLVAQMDVERHRVQALRRAIAEGIEADVAILDALVPEIILGDGLHAGNVTLALTGELAA